MNRRERILAITVAALVGLFFLDQFVIQPVSTRLGNMSDRADQLEDELRTARLLVNNREIIETRWQTYRAAALEADESAQRLRIQRSLNEWAAEAGLDLAALSSGRTGTIERDRFHEMRFILRGTGSLAAAVRFLHHIRRSTFPLRIVACDFGARSEEEDKLSLQLTVSTIRLAPDTDDGNRDGSEAGP